MSHSLFYLVFFLRSIPKQCHYLYFQYIIMNIILIQELEENIILLYLTNIWILNIQILKAVKRKAYNL